MGPVNHPTLEELWRNTAFIRGLVQLADGNESPALGNPAAMT